MVYNTTGNNYLYFSWTHAIFVVVMLLLGPVIDYFLMFYCSSVFIAGVYLQHYMKANCRVDDTSGVRKWDDLAKGDYTSHDLKWESHPEWKDPRIDSD